MALMEACLVVLRGRAGRPEAAPLYQIVVPEFWRVSDAIARMQTMLHENPDDASLGHFLPPLDASERDLELRAAVASTLVAGLELARICQARMQQDQTFSPITLGLVPQPDKQPVL